MHFYCGKLLVVTGGLIDPLGSEDVQRKWKFSNLEDLTRTLSVYGVLCVVSLQT